MKLINNKVYFAVQDYLMILLGTLLYGFGFNAFILSNEIITGGVSGICALIFFASNEIIPVSVSYFVINVVLLLAALIILGLKFLIKTIFGVFSLSASLSFFEWLLKGQPLLHDQPFMSIIIGAFLCGAGLGLVFSANGSTGGTDIVGAIVNKYKNISIGRALLFCDFIIIGSSFFLFHDVFSFGKSEFFIIISRLGRFFKRKSKRVIYSFQKKKQPTSVINPGVSCFLSLTYYDDIFTSSKSELNRHIRGLQ